ncbi:metacaspase-2-like isoform X2 [Vanessa atalanta]|uniref:metacaspase-2-like isoform X2 n=1 Tax=Vanessa atalanta TaxID=42275 RepID=UPI001FCDFCD8|nr:metacaspase-2-like isoform X2 [Vanessa atalanta]
MNDGISQSFKVEWLNTTLKFIKNDNQMIMEFPEMPASHVEYLHNLIWQRKNDVGLGFKSLYAPLWEAMRIYSLKYRFKVSVLKSTDNTGHLVIEKIKKTDQGEERADSNNEELVTDAAKVSQPRTDKQIKKKKETKSEKYLKEKSKIIESISPPFLRTALQRILDFIKDEKEASLLFTDLAPIEAKFLENFLGIYNRRYMFETMMSPACNNIFNEMWKCFNQFDKTCKLEVDASKTNMKTKKREVSFLKVPRYVRPTMTRAMLKKEQKQAEVESSLTADKNDVNPRSKFLKALSVNKDLRNEINAPPPNIQVRSNVRTVSNALEIKAQNDDSKNSSITDNQNMLNTINKCVIDKKTTEVNGNNCTKICDKKNLATINNPIIDNIHRTESNLVCKEEYKECYKRELKDDQEEDTTSTSVTYYVLQSEEKSSIEIKTSNKDRYKSSSREKNVTSDSIVGNTSLNDKNNLPNSCKTSAKESIASKFLKDPSQMKLPPKKSITFEKSTELDTTSAIGVQDINSYIEKRAKERKKESCSRKNKLMEAMSIPLESDKGLRMMQLMGWEGGALGLRGEGITEPIIPMLYLAPGAGLGHATEKSLIKQAKVDFRIYIFEKILNLLDKDISDVGINFKNEISKKEKRFLKTTLLSFNKRKKISLSNGVENNLGQKILDKMIIDSNMYIDMTISSNNREILIKKIFPDDNENQSKPSNKKNIKAVSKNAPTDANNINSNVLKLPGKKRDFKILILSKILELVKSEDEYVEINFDSALLSKYCDCLEKTCSNINERRKFYGKCVKVIAEEVNDNIGDTCLKVEYGTNMMSLTLRKKIYENSFINSATNALATVRNNSEEINDNATICTKTDVKNDTNLSKNFKDNEILVKNKNLDVNDELDKDTHEVLHKKSNQSFKLDVHEYYDVINQNSLNIESRDNTHDGNKIDKSVANDCDNDIAKRKTENIDNKELKIHTLQSNDANNNRNDLVTLRKLLQIKTDLSNKKKSTENNSEKSVELNTLHSVYNTDNIHSKETKPSKEILSKEFEINTDKLKENISDEINTSREFSKKTLNKQKVSTFINSYNKVQKTVIIAKTSDMRCTLFLKVIQNLLANNISENFLPQLKCHGIDKRGVIYSCYNEDTYYWLKEVLSDYKIIDYNGTIDIKFTVQIKINTMFEVKRVLILLELCNVGLCCDNWMILEEKYSDFSVFIVDMDRDSFNYVCDNNFKLSIGVDEALFSIYCYL